MHKRKTWYNFQFTVACRPVLSSLVASPHKGSSVVHTSWRCLLATSPLALALCLVATDTEAQSRCPRSTSFMTMQKQSQTTQMFQQMQMQSSTMMMPQQPMQFVTRTYPQQQMPPMVPQTKSPPTALTKGPTTPRQSVTANTQTNTAMKQCSPGTVCNHTKPQLLTNSPPAQQTALRTPTGTTPSKTVPTATPNQQTTLRTTTTPTILKNNPTPIPTAKAPPERTNVALTPTVTKKPAIPVEVTKANPTLKTVTTTNTQTKMLVSVNQQCNSCHCSGSKPTAVANGRPLPQMAPQNHPVQLPMLMGQVPQPYQLPTALNYSPRPLQVALAQPRPLQLPMANVLPVDPLPTSKAQPSTQPLELALFLRTPIPDARPKFDPLVSTTATRPAASINLTPLVVVEPTPDSLQRTTGLYLHPDQQLPIETKPTPRQFPVLEHTAMPLGLEDLQQPPTRRLAAGVLMLPALARVQEILDEEEELLPPLPAVLESPLSRDPQEFFHPATTTTTTPAPAPRPVPAALPGPATRSTTLMPG